MHVEPVTTQEQHRERTALETLAKPYRWKTGWSGDGEAVMIGKRGQIEWHEPTMTVLAAYTTNMNLIRQWLTVDWVTSHQRGDKEWRATFPVSHLVEMADLIRVKVKRHPGAHLKQFHFQSRLQGQKTAQESTIEGQEGVTCE